MHVHTYRRVTAKQVTPQIRTQSMYQSPDCIYRRTEAVPASVLWQTCLLLSALHLSAHILCLLLNIFLPLPGKLKQYLSQTRGERKKRKKRSSIRYFMSGYSFIEYSSQSELLIFISLSYLLPSIIVLLRRTDALCYFVVQFLSFSCFHVLILGQK